MSLITLSSEDCEMIEKCVDMISMQCRMIGGMLRRSREASGVQPARHDVLPPENSEGMVEMLNNAVSTLASTVRQVSTEIGPHGDPHTASRKRSRMRHGSVLPDAYDDAHLSVESLQPHATTPPPAKRRGRPPRDYGDELGPAFAAFASENYQKFEQNIVERGGGAPVARPPKHEVLRSLWDSWWLSAQNMKDRYLGISRHEMAVNETHMLELLVDYPLPNEAIAAQAGLRSSTRTVSRSPEPVSPFDVFLREQIPILRSKVPDWSDGEIHRRLTASWNTMPPADREKYSAAATLAAASPAPHVIHSSLAATPTSAGPASRGLSSGAGYKHGGRAPSQTTPRRAYVLFCRQERPLLVQANPEWDLPTVNKELGRKWKELTTDQKEVFHDLERKEYESRMVAASVSSGAPGAEPYGTPGYHRNGSYYSGISTPTGSGRPYGGEVAFMARPSKSGAPGGGNPHKGPSKAYVFYSRLNRKGVTSEHPDWDLATVNRELGRMWKTLTLEERHSWEARAAAAAAGDVESASSTPQPRGSPAILTNAPAPASTVTPSPIPAALSMNSENASVSIPATPQSGITTPTAKEDVTMTDRPDYNGEGEGEAEDVEMQDEETEEDEPHSSAGPLKASPLGGAPHTPIPPASTALGSSASHGPAAAPVVLPRHQPVSFSRAPIPAVGPPPTAKPAAVVSNGTGSSAASTPSLHADAMPHAH